MLAAISLAATGVVVTGVAGKSIRVLGYVIVATTPVTAQWSSGATALSGAMPLIAGVPVVCPAAPMVVAGRAAYLETISGDDLKLTLGAGVQVSGHLEYEFRTL